MAITDRCDDINELHPKVKELAQQLLAKAKEQGLNIKIIDTYRSVVRQDFLYASGRTRPGAIITNARGSAMSSYHQWRLAFDIINNDAKDLYNEVVLNKVGAIGQSLGLEWGGSWTTFVDKPHFQFTYGLSINQLNAGAKIPMYTPNDGKKEVALKETKVNVLGEVLNVHTLNIDGNNYIKLRSLESKYITIGYVNGIPTVNYITNGNDAAPTVVPANTRYSVKVIKTKIKVGDEVIDADAVNVEGNNYIKLRALESKLFTIGYANGVPTVMRK